MRSRLQSQVALSPKHQICPKSGVRFAHRIFTNIFTSWFNGRNSKNNCLWYVSMGCMFVVCVVHMVCNGVVWCVPRCVMCGVVFHDDVGLPLLSSFYWTIGQDQHRPTGLSLSPSSEPVYTHTSQTSLPSLHTTTTTTLITTCLSGSCRPMLMLLNTLAGWPHGRQPAIFGQRPICQNTSDPKWVHLEFVNKCTYAFGLVN